MSLFFVLVFTIAKTLACKDKSSTQWCVDNSFLCKSPMWISRMIENCQRTCNYCTMTLPPTTTTGQVTNAPTGCFDKTSARWCVENIFLCTNPDWVSYMSQSCQRTCNYCTITTTPRTQPPTGPVTNGTSQTECGNPKIQTGRVIAGTTPTKGAWPWQTLLFEGGIEFCGGTLINREWVLTAAHCIHGKEYDPTQIVVRTGEHNINVNEGTEENIVAIKIIKHRGYNPLTHDNDIALIKIARPCKLNDHVSTACLPNKDVAPGISCFITGWGKTSHPGDMTDVLQQGKMNIVDQKTCENLNRRTIPHPITKAMICAGDGGSTKMSGCHGDSGGPLVCSIGGRWFVHGTVSHGSGECRSDETYTVFANVNYFRSWIISSMLL